MAGFDFREDRAPDTPPDATEERVRVQAVLNAFGAALSIALVIGIGIWGYNLMVRDVSGVPVVRALEGPMRVSPENPGGRQAAYQGLAVNRVAADGEAAELPDEIVLAPQPLSLRTEDQPVPALVRNPPSAEPPDPEERIRSVSFDVAAAVSAALADVETTPTESRTIARSPRPRPRPTGEQLAALTAVPSSDTLGPETTREIDPETIAPGTRLVQLGAYDDVETARVEWDRLADRFAAVLEDRDRVIETAVSGGRSFYRLRAHGFADDAEARRFCAVLLAENADCIPVLVR